jgi:hypothetical protein
MELRDVSVLAEVDPLQPILVAEQHRWPIRQRRETNPPGQGDDLVAATRDGVAGTCSRIHKPPVLDRRHGRRSAQTLKGERLDFTSTAGPAVIGAPVHLR